MLQLDVDLNEPLWLGEGAGALIVPQEIRIKDRTVRMLILAPVSMQVAPNGEITDTCFLAVQKLGSTAVLYPHQLELQPTHWVLIGDNLCMRLIGVVQNWRPLPSRIEKWSIRWWKKEKWKKRGPFTEVQVRTPTVQLGFEPINANAPVPYINTLENYQLRSRAFHETAARFLPRQVVYWQEPPSSVMMGEVCGVTFPTSKKGVGLMVSILGTRDLRRAEWDCTERKPPVQIFAQDVAVTEPAL